MAKGKFTVDTHLFRELGELLVGRDSTALVELIKNAYDADAKDVTVHGESLGDASVGTITLGDDGVGMTRAQFESGFLRVASRMKDDGDRKSVRYRRRYTGAKGIGRLAAHKLAQLIEVESHPDAELAGSDAKGVSATIDWNKVEECTTLDDVAGSDAIEVRDLGSDPAVKPGTIITLRQLRKNWTQAERARFFAEVQTFSPPSILVDPPVNVVAAGELLFERPRISDSKASDPGFRVTLSGEFEAGEEYWPALLQAASWVLEIEASKAEQQVRFNILPTRATTDEYARARKRLFVMKHPDPKNGPFFQSRILIREGAIKGVSDRAWIGRSSGIRVYMEGFRVLPYGEPKDDWLSLDADYKKRQKTLPHLSGLGFAGDPADDNEGLLTLGNSGYFGAVYLRAIGSPHMRMLVNREGFVPEGGYDALVEILRTAINLSTRVRAASRIQEREARREDRKDSAVASIEPSRLELRQAVEISVKRASDLANEARQLAASGDFAAAREKINLAAAEYSVGSDTSQRLMTEGAILRVLASVGTQMAAFVHEINGLLGSAQSLERAVASFRDDPETSPASRKKLSELLHAIGDLRRAVERQAIYLTDVISADSRRRRSRQKLADRFDAGCRLVQAAAERRGVSIVNEVPSDLRSPPMFPAELTLVFSNLLTNAVKAAGERGRIRAGGGESSQDEGSTLRIENSGVAVNPTNGERWFRPFESTTTQTDAILGQGMGMGLPITRNILEEYGATIQFVKPSKGYSTAIEIRFPK